MRRMEAGWQGIEEARVEQRTRTDLEVVALAVQATVDDNQRVRVQFAPVFLSHVVRAARVLEREREPVAAAEACQVAAVRTRPPARAEQVHLRAHTWLTRTHIGRSQRGARRGPAPDKVLAPPPWLAWGGI